MLLVGFFRLRAIAKNVLAFFPLLRNVQKQEEEKKKREEAASNPTKILKLAFVARRARAPPDNFVAKNKNEDNDMRIHMHVYREREVLK